MARALWAGPAATRALSAGGEGSVEIALRPGGYVRLADDWLLVAAPRAPRGPLTLLVAGLERHPLRAGEPARADGATLAIGPLNVELDHMTTATAPARSRLRPSWRVALTSALEACPCPPAELAAGIAALRRGDLPAAAAALAGCGRGLTPAGDDVLAGYAAWRHAADAAPPVAAARRCAGGAAPSLSELAAGRASPIGLAYLRCAERGELPELAARALRAIRAGEAEPARLRARALSRWGASSGAAILWGVAAGACP